MMSIKELFSSYNTTQIQKAETVESASVVVESGDFIEAKREQFDQFIPDIDFSNTSQFAKFGSAELYYENSFKRIYQRYPYDGTLAEKTEFHNSSSYLDKYVFDYLYPGSNGYIVLDGTSYIKVLGGPHTASGGMIGKTLDSTFENSMIYSPEDRRASGFEMTMVSGSTIEFWLKRTDANTSADEYIFDMWNGETDAALNGRLSLFLASGTKNLQFTLVSGSDNITNQLIASDAIDGNWNHFSFTLQAVDGSTNTKLYKNNELVYQANLASISDIRAVSSGVNATIGAKIRTEGDNKLNGSLDEFRFWKVARTHESISSTWILPVGGGTNKHHSNTDLGVYFKFNEGITGNDSTDKVVLDYSGRIHNGMWVGYSAGQRNTGSAFISSSYANSEFEDPIIYSDHPEVSASLALYKGSGSISDLRNNSLIYGYFPAWMQETDEEGGKNLKYLSQIIGSYFDTLWHQINYLNKIKDEKYVSGSNKPLPFADKLLYNRGFVMPNLFGDATTLEKFRQRDDNEIYEKEIYEVKNTIYHNLYNNLLGIYKSKGTEKSFRNFFRSMGINSELVRFNMYADDSTFVLRDNYMYKSFEKKFLNFNFENHFDGTIFNLSSSAYSNTNNYIPAGSDFESFTLETEIILPKKSRSEPGFISFSNLTASVMGYHSASSDDTDDLTWGGGKDSSGGGSFDHTVGYSPNDHDLHVLVVKEKTEDQYNVDSSQRIKYVLSGSKIGEHDSPFFSYQYENNKWNLALRLKSHVYPYTNVTGALSGAYTIELYGIEAEANITRNSFLVSTTVADEGTTDNHLYVQSPRRFYGGAHKINFTGSDVYLTDIKMGHMRYWHSYMSDAAINQHAFDPETFGINEPFESDLIGKYSFEVPREKTLAFHWAFDLLTGSTGAGTMTVLDQSSGSSNNDYGPSLSPIIQRHNLARVEGFPSEVTNILDKNFLYVARKRQPDNLHSSDLTRIMSEDTENFFTDDDVSDNFYSFEKSMYGTISDSMLNMFSTALDFNNLIGQFNQRYHQEYSLMSFLKEKFFEDIENDIDIEKFITFYKWIDDSVSKAMEQLIPASARFSKKINNVIESHVLERNKYVNKMPLLTRFKSTEGSMRGVQELLYDWETGHAPLNNREDNNCLWQRDRKERTGVRDTIKNVKANSSIQSSGLIRKEVDGTAYLGPTYFSRKFSKPFNFEAVTVRGLHGGTNYRRDKNRNLIFEALHPHGVLGISPAHPQNIITIGANEGQGIIEPVDCDDPVKGNEKVKFAFGTELGRFVNDEYKHRVKGDIAVPFTLVKGTLHTGYNKVVKSYFRSDVIITNLHSDTTYNTNDIPMQGPFTETHVGGHQSRHVPINKFDTSKSMLVLTPVGAAKATATVEFDVDFLQVGDTVEIADADATAVTASFHPFFDLADEKFTTRDELILILNDKLDVTAVASGTKVINLTQNAFGTDGNQTITKSTTRITASGFSSGVNASSTTTLERNLDSPSNRAEAWGLVFGDHPVMAANDVPFNDGIMGFVGADYGATYPNRDKIRATKFRDEHAKRPVNIRNIQYGTGSSVIGNYRKGYELVMLQKADQKRWHRDAYDSDLILPVTTKAILPDTTHYMTLMSQAPFEAGNVFGTHQNNRQPDTESLVLVPAVTAVTAQSMRFEMSGSEFAQDGDQIRIDTTGSSGTSYELDVLGNGVTGGFTAITVGGSDTDFYNNMEAAIESATGLAVTYDSSPTDFSKGLHWSRRNETFLKRVGGLGAGNQYPHGATDPVSVGFVVALSGANTTDRIFYVEEDSGTTRERLRIDYLAGSGGRLRVQVNYNDGSPRSNELFFETFENFFTEDGSIPVKKHILVTYDGGVNEDSLTLFINGVSQSCTVNVDTESGTPVAPDGAIYVGGKPSSNNTITGTNLCSSSLDEFVILNKVASAGEIVDLYNNGIAFNSNTFGTLNYTSSIKTYLNFNDTGAEIVPDGQIIPDVKGFQNFTASVAVAAGLMQANTQLAHTPGSASFLLQGASPGTAFNGHIEFPDASKASSFRITDSLQDNGVDGVAEISRASKDIVITIPRTDLTSSTYEINTRFSAPGGPEIQSIGYLDAQTSTFSVYNALPYRNLSILGSGSGESSTIRVTDHLNQRRGLRTNLQQHMGKFGADIQLGSVTSTGYVVNGSVMKQHRNINRKMTISQTSTGEVIVTGSVFDNGFISSPIPRSEFQYSWILSAVSGTHGWQNDQRILGYSRPDGIVTSSLGMFDAILFPTSSGIGSLIH